MSKRGRLIAIAAGIVLVLLVVPTHSFQLSGGGFAPGEAVDIFLGSNDNTQTPLVTATADDHGGVAARNVIIPMLRPGDYTLTLIGRSSNIPTSVGFNIQGFHPWVTLDNYYIPPHSGVGISGVDFVPGEVVQMYLNTRESQPVAQVTADSDGRFEVNNAFSLPDLRGNNQLSVVGQQSRTEVTATFAAAAAD
jgi:hypothetical protein